MMGAMIAARATFHNHGEGRYRGLLLVEITYVLALSHLRHYCLIATVTDMPSPGKHSTQPEPSILWQGD